MIFNGYIVNNYPVRDSMVCFVGEYRCPNQNQDIKGMCLKHPLWGFTESHKAIDSAKNIDATYLCLVFQNMLKLMSWCDMYMKYALTTYRMRFGAGTARWRERLSLASASRVRFRSGAICGLNLLFFLALLRGFFYMSPVFLPPQNPTSPNSNLTKIEDVNENQLSLMQLSL